jgi:long-chain acyl-CoA synthetase
MQCGFFGGDVLKLVSDMQTLRPTFFISVPRLFNKFYDKVKATLNEATGMKGWLVQKALAAKLYYVKNGEGYTHSVYDALVFNKTKAFLGGRVRIMLTGSAPISADVLDFLKVVFCCPVTEGYGMTESGGGSCVTFCEDF